MGYSSSVPSITWTGLAVRGLATITLRYANVFGPRQNPGGEAGVVSIFGLALITGATVTVFGDGLQTRNFVFVDDVARANLLAGDSAPQGSVNIGMGVEATVTGILDKLASLCGVERPPVTWCPPRTGEVARSCLDPTLAASVLRFSPSIPLAIGLGRPMHRLRATDLSASPVARRQSEAKASDEGERRQQEDR